MSLNLFNVIDLHGDTTENLVLLVMQVIGKMKQTGHPAFSIEVAKALVQQIWDNMARILNVIYTHKRIFPPALPLPSTVDPEVLEQQLQQINEISFDDTEDQLGLWKTLELILGKLVQHQSIRGCSYIT